jgi:hypothetical protein
MPGGGRASITGRSSFSSSFKSSPSYSKPSSSSSSRPSISSSSSSPSTSSSISSSDSFLSWFIPYHFFFNNSPSQKVNTTLSSLNNKSKEDCKKYKEELDECLKKYSKDSLMYKIKESIYEDCIKKKIK